MGRGRAALALRRMFALAALALLIGGCGREAAPPSMDDVRAGSEPISEAWDIRFVISEAAGQADDSRPRLIIYADYMAGFETADSTYTEMRSEADGRQVEAYLHDEAGDTSAVIRSDRLILQEEERRFEAFGNVRVRTSDDKTLQSEHLVWIEDDRMVRTPGFVRIETPTERIQGYSLVADEDLETYSLARVTGQVTIDDDEEGDDLPDAISETED